MTPEEIAKSHQDWADKREARRIELEEKCHDLTDEQVKAIKSAYDALQETESNEDGIPSPLHSSLSWVLLI